MSKVIVNFNKPIAYIHHNVKAKQWCLTFSCSLIHNRFNCVSNSREEAIAELTAAMSAFDLSEIQTIESAK